MTGKPSWMIDPEEFRMRHWCRASEIAGWFDKVTGSNEVAAGAILGLLIRDAPPGTTRISTLCSHAGRLQTVPVVNTVKGPMKVTDEELRRTTFKAVATNACVCGKASVDPLGGGQENYKTDFA